MTSCKTTRIAAAPAPAPRSSTRSPRRDPDAALAAAILEASLRDDSEWLVALAAWQTSTLRVAPPPREELLRWMQHARP